MAQQFFEKLSNDVLEATEQIADRMEEGIKLMFAGEGSTNSPTPTPDTGDFTIEEELDDLKEDGLGDTPLRGIAEEQLKNIMENNAGPQTLTEHFEAFRSAITWSEPFILSLIAFQVIIFVLAMYVSRRGAAATPRILLMLTIAGIVKGSEFLNDWASNNWQQFCTQNYFDKNGVFMTTMAPLLLDSLIMLFKYLREASQLLVQVKTAQMKQKMQKEKRRAKKDQ